MSIFHIFNTRCDLPSALVQRDLFASPLNSDEIAAMGIVLERRTLLADLIGKASTALAIMGVLLLACFATYLSSALDDKQSSRLVFTSIGLMAVAIASGVFWAWAQKSNTNIKDRINTLGLTFAGRNISEKELYCFSLGNVSHESLCALFELNKDCQKEADFVARVLESGRRVTRLEYDLIFDGVMARDADARLKKALATALESPEAA